jgi:hypothetical protein
MKLMTVLEAIRELSCLENYKSNSYVPVLFTATEFCQFTFLIFTEKKISHECVFETVHVPNVLHGYEAF